MIDNFNLMQSLLLGFTLFVVYQIGRVKGHVEAVKYIIIKEVNQVD